MKRFNNTIKKSGLGFLLGASLFIAPNLSAIVDKPETAAFLDQIADKNGGKAALRQIHSWKYTGKLKKANQEFDAIMVRKAPNKVRLNIKKDGRRIIVAYDGETAWTQVEQDCVPQMSKHLDGESKIDVARDAYFLYPYLNYRNSDYHIRRLPDEKLSNRASYVIETTYEDIEVVDKFYIDQEKYTLTQRVMTKPLADGSTGKITTIYGKYEPINGVKIPFRAVTKQGDVTIATLDWTDISPNQGIFDSYFEFKPMQTSSLLLKQ